MRSALLVLLLLLTGCSANAIVSTPAVRSAQSGVALPDPRLTPGEAFAGVAAAEVCTIGWARDHRNVLRDQYVAVYAAYGLAYPQPAGSYELDHLIPLELGGDNDDANLWPETAAPPGFHQKDELETRLHDMVCSGQMGLDDAQRAIATNWYAAYQRYG